MDIKLKLKNKSVSFFTIQYSKKRAAKKKKKNR
jgi:hypothetical protein